VCLTVLFWGEIKEWERRVKKEEREVYLEQTKKTDNKNRNYAIGKQQTINHEKGEIASFELNRKSIFVCLFLKKKSSNGEEHGKQNKDNNLSSTIYRKISCEVKWD